MTQVKTLTCSCSCQLACRKSYSSDAPGMYRGSLYSCGSLAVDLHVTRHEQRSTVLQSSLAYGCNTMYSCGSLLTVDLQRRKERSNAVRQGAIKTEWRHPCTTAQDA
jgi:hypothetical protein